MSSRKKEILVIVLLASLLLFLIVKNEPMTYFEFTDVVVETNSTHATIYWATTVDTRYTFEYYAEENFTRWGIQGFDEHDYSLNYSITLYNVKQNTTYRFRVTAIDVEGNREYYESNFTTSAKLPAWIFVSAVGGTGSPERVINVTRSEVEQFPLLTRGIHLADTTRGVHPDRMLEGTNEEGWQIVYYFGKQYFRQDNDYFILLNVDGQLYQVSVLFRKEPLPVV